MSRALTSSLGLALLFLSSGDSRKSSESAEEEEIRVGDGETTATLRLTTTEHGEVVLRPTRFGVEDFVAIDQAASDRGVLEYVLTLKEWTRGVRLIGRSLELLDRNGAPRVRMLAPYLVDHRHAARAVHVGIEGCAVDTNPAPPFGRTDIPAPGRDQCTLRLSWDRHAPLDYPIVVDPGWMTTGVLATPRNRHISMKLPNGDVLVAGGLVPDPDATEVSSKTAEIYSVTNGVWAATGAMNYPRAWAAAASLANGDVLISGGFDQTLLNGQMIQESAEIYSVATGTWSKTTGNLMTPRAGHSAAALGDGTVLIAAGFDNSGDHFTTTEIFTPGTSMFTSAGDLNVTRFDHASVALPSGRLLIVGGGETMTGALASIELYTKGAGWSTAANLPSMMVRRSLPSVAALANGDAIISGGYNRADGSLASAEIYHLATNTITPVVNSLAKPRYDHIAVSLPNGQALFIGGQTTTGHYADGELFDPATSMFTRVRGMAAERVYGHQASTLNDGRVLVSGGYDAHTAAAIGATDIFDPNADAGAFLPDDDEKDAGPPVNPNPHPDIDGGGQWPPLGDGRPGGRDASTDDAAAAPIVPKAPEADALNVTSSPLTGGGSGCSSSSSSSSSSGSPLAMIAALLLLCVRRRRQER